MSHQIVPQSPSPRNQQVIFIPADQIPEPQLPALIYVGSQFVYAPILEPDGTLVVDTGKSILELDRDELDILRAVIAAWDAHREVV